MAIVKPRRVRITSEDGLAINTKVETEDGIELHATSVRLDCPSYRDNWRAVIEVNLPRLNVLTDAELELWSPEIEKLQTQKDELAALICELLEIYKHLLVAPSDPRLSPQAAYYKDLLARAEQAIVDYQ